MIPQSVPIGPREAIRDTVNWYGAEGFEYRQALNAHVDSINRRLRGEIVKCHTVGDTAGVEVLLPGVSQVMLLDLVLTYREAGWNVTYGCGEDTRPYMVIGLNMRS